MPNELPEEEVNEEISSWHIPLNSSKRWTLERALETMGGWKLEQEDVPLIIKLTENPNYLTARLLGGAVDLFTHDCIHILLGRGILVKDEAFVIGYTMGSSKKMSRLRRNLFMFICKHFYPEGYKFGEEERYVFNSAVLLGQKCPIDLSEVNFDTKEMRSTTLNKLRNELGLDEKQISRYYSLERCLFNDRESKRLL